MNATELKLGDYVLFNNTIAQLSSIDITYCCGVDIPKGIASTDRKSATLMKYHPFLLLKKSL